MIGQDAVNAAKTFDEALDITGVMLTKLDGDARGGAALSIKAVTGKPIKFVGVGEKLDQVELFYPDRMASRILGMGDVLSLIEKAQQTLTPRRPPSWSRSSARTSLPWLIFTISWFRSRAWVPCPTSPGCSPA